MPAQLFEELLGVALVPLAQIQKHPECFDQGLRLIAVDGTEFFLSNTPQVLGKLTKAACRRWEGGLDYRPLKLERRSGELLPSHTVHTAAQELACLVMASAWVARRKIQCAQACPIEPWRVSFTKVGEATRALWPLLDISQSILSANKSNK